MLVPYSHLLLRQDGDSGGWLLGLRGRVKRITPQQTFRVILQGHV